MSEIQTSDPRIRCPHCAFKALADDQGVAPEPGDLLTCCRCAELSLLEEDLTARTLTPQERRVALTIPEIRVRRQLILGYIRGRQTRNN